MDSDDDESAAVTSGADRPHTCVQAGEQERDRGELGHAGPCSPVRRAEEESRRGATRHGHGPADAGARNHVERPRRRGARRRRRRRSARKTRKAAAGARVTGGRCADAQEVAAGPRTRARPLPGCGRAGPDPRGRRRAGERRRSRGGARWFKLGRIGIGNLNELNHFPYVTCYWNHTTLLPVTMESYNTFILNTISYN